MILLRRYVFYDINAIKGIYFIIFLFLSSILKSNILQVITTAAVDYTYYFGYRLLFISVNRH